GNRGYLVSCDDRGVRLEDVGSIGLIGAGPRRAVFDGCVVPGERIFEIGALPVVAADVAPAIGDPYVDTVALAVADHLAIVRGAGNYLTERARDHAASRVQFPGSFQDEAGRDTIAKFGAVKQMLAEMEAQRVLVESLSLVDPDPDDAAVGAAVRKLLAADAFGPRPGSFSYNCGQVFGGTAFSEDDCIAKYYRDASPFRFLLAHDDALRVRVGRRRLDAVAAGEPLVPLRTAEAAWIDALHADEPLARVTARWRAACTEIDEWAAGAAARRDGGELDDLLCWQAGEMTARALAVKVCILRSTWRLEAGLPAAATVEATALLTDRFGAEAPRWIGEAELLGEGLRVGAESVTHGDFEPGARIADAEPYDAVLASDFAARSGIWLERPYDGDHPRYIPEILWNDERLRSFRERVEEEQKLRFVVPRFDGLTYNRWVEKLHRIPDEDLHYLIERGYFRMPIAADLGGEAALKAEYYIVCEMTGRFGDAAQSLAIMANTSIGTTPFTIGLYQDLPRARAELEKVKHDPSVLGDIETALDALIAGLERPDFDKLQAGYLELSGTVKKAIAKSAVLKYIGAGFLRAFFAAGKAGQRKDMDGFGAKLVQARALIDEILTGVEDRLAEYPRRQRAHETALRMISAGYTSAFALTEPTAGSDSGGVKTTARPDRRRVHADEDGVLHFFLDEENRAERRNLLDVDRLEFDYDRKRLLYRFSDDAPPSEIGHEEYDYEKDRAGHWRTYMHGDRKVAFTDIAEIRDDGEGKRWYEFWELNGAKMWITNGRFAHLFALYALTDPEGVTGFIVDRHAEGLVVGSDEEKLGQRGSPTNELSLTGVRVPRENIIGFRGRGQVNALETLNTGRTGLAVSTRATIQEMMDDAVDYLGGQREEPATYARQADPPAALQKYWVGRLMEQLVCSAAVAHELIGLFDHPLTVDVRMESAIGKYWNSEAEHDGIELMERLRGLDGLTHRHRIEKTRRDARVLNIYEGTNEVQRYLLLRDLVQRILPAWRAANGPDGAAGAAQTADGPYPELRNRLEVAKHSLLSRLDQADATLGALVWANVNLQPCFFRLAEIAGFIKVMDALLYRLEWLAEHDVPEEYGARLRRASRLAFERCLLEVAALDRRFSAAYAYVQDGRYPPEAQLGFLSLDERGAAAERFGVAPAGLLPQPRPERLARTVRIAVLAKPVPVTAPRPRFGADTFAESLYAIDPVDARSLELALGLKQRDPQRIHVAVYSIAGSTGAEMLQQALAAGADDVTLIGAPDDAEVLHDPAAVARTISRALAAAPADVVLCGAVASDTGQGAVAALLAGLLGREYIERALDLRWSGDAEPLLRVTAVGWQGHELDLAPPAVIAVEPPGESAAPQYGLGELVAALGEPVHRLTPAELGGIDAMPVWHGARRLAARDDDGRIATTPEEAA
ncbi:MAG: acyl-CoA dehydrogenase family protein, partial [Acidobacteriota bacterium]